MKKIIFILAAILVVLLSCSPQDDAAPTETTPIPEVQDTAADTDTISESAEVIEELPELPLGGCTPHWGCISSDIKAYQQEDCSWVERKECPLGCVEGACKAGNTCTPGFRCKDPSTKAYQTETCRWNNEKECEWGCEDGKCNLPPGNGTINQTAEPEQVEVKEEAIPDITYEDIGGLDEEIKKIREMIELPLKHPELFEALGIEAPKGVLLHGPPGTGKTLLAKAVANETNAYFIVINGPEIMCVDGDTKIFTNPKGYVKAKDVFDGAKGKVERDDNVKIVALDEPVKTFAFSDNKIKKSQITHVARLKAKAYKVQLSDGNAITGSKNQPFLAYENGQLVWKPLEKLRQGMFVARLNKLDLPEKSQELTLGGFEHRNGSYAPKGRNLSRSNWIKIPKKTSPKLLEFLGLVVSEGYVAEDGVTFANNDQTLRNLFKSLLKNLFAITKTKEYADGRVVVYSKTLVAFLSLFDLRPGKKQPKIPSLFYNLPKKEIAAFTRGYFDGDGTVSMTGNYPTPILYSASRAFLQEFQGLLLLKLNVPVSLKSHNTPKGMMYKLSMRGNEGRQEFCKWIKPASVEKQKKLSKLRQGKKTWANIPPPKLLVDVLRAQVPYRAYRNNDYYIYNKGKFTLHALQKLYDIAKQYDCITPILRKEYEILSRNDIAWEQITSIQDMGEQELYDFTVDDDSFVAGPYVILHNSKFYGQSEENIRKKFEEGEKNAPAIIFIDEIDAIASKREETRGEVERRVVAQLLAMMDGLKSRGKVVVIAATNVPNILDPALRRPGRFDREIEVGVPKVEGRLNILKIHTRNMPLAKNVDLEELAKISHGFVGADLASLAKEAAMVVLRRVLADTKIYDKDEAIPKELLEKLRITKEDFKEALRFVRPSALREVLVEVPNIKWEDIGGLETVKQELKEAVEWPLKHPDAFKRLGVRPPKGILLYGPPGTGKTLLAKAVANESEANFISVKGPELLSKWVGESEKGVREVFKKARQSAPTVIFFDEIDSIAPRRGISGDSHVTERMVNQILTEMDGLVEMHDVVIIGATNRPDIVDPALLRPGRFDRIILTPVPSTEARENIFKVHTAKMPLSTDVNLRELAEKTEGYVGADVEAVCREAAILALREDIMAKEITKKHFEAALNKVRPSVSKEVEETYESIKDQFSAAQAKAMKQESPNYFG